MSIWSESQYDLVGEGHRRFYGTAAPALATDIAGFSPQPGDTIQKTNPDVGGTFEYICIAAPTTAFPAGQWIEMQAVQSSAITLTSAQILAMNTTPVSVIPAQGAGTLIEVLSAVADYIYGTAQYTSGGAIGLFYGVETGPLATATLASTFLTSPTVNQIGIMEGALASSASSTVLNTAIVISNQSGVFATGNGTMIVKVKYRVHIGLS